VGSVPSWATRENYVAPAEATTDVGFRVYLGWTNPAAAEALARSVSDPHSTTYGKFLTPNQFSQSVSRRLPADVAKVQNWLRSQGFSIIYSPQNNHYVSAEGSVSQLAAAFGAQFGNLQCPWPNGAPHPPAMCRYPAPSRVSSSR